MFNGDRYFDVFVEYAKAQPEDICIRIEAVNRGPEAAELHIIPTLWFRNIWAWGDERGREPIIRVGASGTGYLSLIADDSGATGLTQLPFEYRLGRRILYAEPDGALLFTENETHMARMYGARADDGRRYVKDAFHRHIIHSEDCVNPLQLGTKAGVHYRRTIPAGGTAVWRLRLTAQELAEPFADLDACVQLRSEEANAFYEALHPPKATPDERRIQRQAIAGLIWSKQNYIFDTHLWLKGDDPRSPPPASRKTIRNQHWPHLKSMRVLSMPDKWEYPWFAAWDLAFHCVPLALVDAEFAKEQLWLLLFDQFQHPNGQIPAYEWEFSDMNPPVHAWAVWRVYNMDRARSGRADRMFLEKCFHKLLINFAWWVNKVDSAGHNVFEGGFLGLDNITVFDRSEKLPGGAEKWPRKFEQRYKWKLRAQCWAVDGLARRSFQWSRNQHGALAARILQYSRHG